MTPDVEAAVADLRACFPDTAVDAVGTGDGGAIVTIARVDPGPAYVQRETWMRFDIRLPVPACGHLSAVRTPRSGPHRRADPRRRHLCECIPRLAGAAVVQAEQPPRSED